MLQGLQHCSGRPIAGFRSKLHSCHQCSSETAGGNKQAGRNTPRQTIQTLAVVELYGRCLPGLAVHRDQALQAARWSSLCRKLDNASVQADVRACVRLKPARLAASKRTRSTVSADLCAAADICASTNQARMCLQRQLDELEGELVQCTGLVQCTALVRLLHASTSRRADVDKWRLSILPPQSHCSQAVNHPTPCFVHRGSWTSWRASWCR